LPCRSIVTLAKESDCGNKSYSTTTYFSLEDSTLHSTGNANDFLLALTIDTQLKEGNQEGERGSGRSLRTLYNWRADEFSAALGGALAKRRKKKKKNSEGRME
jgi:hypothetical protein